MPASGRKGRIDRADKCDLKYHDAVLAKIKNNVSFVSFMDVRNSPSSESQDVLPKGGVEMPIVKSSRVSKAFKV